jgi:Cu+-exporting ATPase
MGLEPETVARDAGPNPELVEMTRRFWLGLAFSVPVIGLEMGEHFVHHMPLSHSASNVLQMVLTIPVVLWAGSPFFVRGWRSLLTKNLNMFTLVAMGGSARPGSRWG